MKAIAVIPARLGSTRMPRKMLREIAGQPLIGLVYQAVRSSRLLDDVIIATDSEEIMAVCRQHGWPARMTSAAHRSGTDRVHEVSNQIAADVYINVQGDEPLTRPEHIALLQELMGRRDVEVGTLKTPAAPADIQNPAAVKVVTDIFPGPPFPMRATATISATSSISAFTLTAKPRWTGSFLCPSHRSNGLNVSSSFAFWRTEFPSTSPKLRSIQLGWIQKKI